MDRNVACVVEKMRAFHTVDGTDLRIALDLLITLDLRISSTAIAHAQRVGAGRAFRGVS